MLQKALRMVRAYHHINQKELGKKLGLSSSHISELESGIKRPTLETLEKYSQCFKIPPSAFLLYSEVLNGEHKYSKDSADKLLKILEWIRECDKFERDNLPNEDCSKETK